jgi:competence protein ComEA
LGARAGHSVAGMDELLPWLRRSGWAYIAVAIALALVAWRMVGGSDSVQGAGERGASTVSVEGPGADPAGAGEVAAPAGARLVVHVTGEVRRPGVYDLAVGARVQRAVGRAGGPTRRADLSLINMAATVQDGQQVVVPAKPTAGAGAGPPAAAGAAGGGPISLSSATQEQLEALDGIGPTLAGRIVAYRQANGGFASVDQLLEVQGIGPARLEAMRPRVVP